MNTSLVSHTKSQAIVAHDNQLSPRSPELRRSTRERHPNRSTIPNVDIRSEVSSLCRRDVESCIIHDSASTSFDLKISRSFYG